MGGGGGFTEILGKLGSMGGSSGGSSGGSGMGGGMMSGGGGGGGMSGNATASGIGTVTALVQTIQALKAKKDARAAAPSKIDPRQAAFLSELNQKRKSIDTGAEFATGMQAIDDTTAATNDAIVHSSGGDAAGTIQALLQSATIAGKSKNAVLARGTQEQNIATGLYANTLDKIAARKMQLQLADQQQAMAEWAAKSKDAFQNWQGSIEQGTEAIRKYYGGQGDTNFSSVNSNTSANANTANSVDSSIPDSGKVDTSILNKVDSNEGIQTT